MGVFQSTLWCYSLTLFPPPSSAPMQAANITEPNSLYQKRGERTIKKDEKIQEAKHTRTVGQRFGDCDFNPVAKHRGPSRLLKSIAFQSSHNQDTRCFLQSSTNIGAMEKTSVLVLLSPFFHRSILLPFSPE